MPLSNKDKAWLRKSGWAETAAEQNEAAFWAQASEAFVVGYTDCRERPALAMYDSVNNEYDHPFNPYRTRSQEWYDYRSGCREYYDRRENTMSKEEEVDL